MTFVDTNYFLRFLLGDVTPQQAQAKVLFRQAAEGKITLFTSAVVLFEIYWVLLSVYGKNKTEIAATLDSLLDMSFIDFEHHGLLKKSIPLYKDSPLGLVDAFNIYYSKFRSGDDFKTFDIKLAKKFTMLAP